MKTSAEWWTGLKNDPERFTDWLRDQYHGEITASIRIKAFKDLYAKDVNPIFRINLNHIAWQESMHAKWIGQLLQARGVAPEVLQKEERYWNETLNGIDSFQTGAGVAAHAELMRLERIRVICKDPEAPEDVRKVFQKILPEEEFHARAFSDMAGAFAMAMTAKAHANGMAAIGLIPA